MFNKYGLNLPIYCIIQTINYLITIKLNTRNQLNRTNSLKKNNMKH